MAKCKQTPHEFIRNAFNPEIAVLCSPSVDNLCQKNNLSFIELLQPFCKLSTDVHYKDPTGAVTTIRDLKLSISDVNSEPPQPFQARKYLNASVSDAREGREVTRNAGEFSLTIPYATPWFEAWREMFLQVQFPSDHEFTKHFLACMLVVSSSEEQPVTSMNEVVDALNQIQTNPARKLPKWFNSNTLRYYVIVHDICEGNENVAHSTMESLRITYGANNCFLLRMNSRPPGKNEDPLPDPWSQFICNRIDTNSEKSPQSSPILSRSLSNLELGEEISESGNNLNYHPLSPVLEDNIMADSFIEKERRRKDSLRHTFHGACLSTRDIEEIKLLVFEFCTRALLPYVERQVQVIGELLSNKKGVGRTFFFTTKRWFSSNKTGPTGVVTNPLYAPDSHELQLRRLGDLYFLFGHYSMAFQAYHSVKRDFEADQAWLYLAGALEMASLSAFMGNMTAQKTIDYMEESITTYLNICKMPQFATRATLFSSECLKHAQMYGEAAHQLIRMTSEESDLRSAVLLEEAAYCFLNSNMVRKYAFHMVLAGHRYSKAAQRNHSLRCYKQANEVYKTKGWIFAEDHINYTIGRQANNLHRWEEAVEAFSMLLSDKSKQSAQQQAVFLKEYVAIYDLLLKSGKVPILILPLPLIDFKLLRFVTGPTSPLLTPGKVPAQGYNITKPEQPWTAKTWHKLEEMVVQEAQGSLPPVFKPVVCLYSYENLHSAQPTAIVHEPVQVYLKLINPLLILLNLRNIFLLWKFQDGSNTVTNATESDSSATEFVKTYATKSLLMQAKGQHDLVLTVTPLRVGRLTLLGVGFDLISTTYQDDVISVTGKLSLDVNGKEIDLNVLPAAPALQVLFSEIYTELLCGEVQKVTIYLQNVGTMPLRNIFVSTSMPDLLSYCEFHRDETRYNRPEFMDNPSLREKLWRKNHVVSVPLPNNRLEPNDSHSINVWLRAPDEKGAFSVDLLFYYENVDIKSVPRYRLVRHVWQLQVQESVGIEVLSATSETEERENIQLTVTNLNKTHHTVLTEVTLVRAALYSGRWRLTGKIHAPKDIKLHSQETAYCSLATKRVLAQQPDYTDVSLKPGWCNSQCDHVYLDFIKRFNYCRFINAFQVVEDVPENESRRTLVSVFWEAFVIGSEKNRIAHGLTLMACEDNVTDALVDHGGFCEANRVQDVPVFRSKDTVESEKAETLVVYNLVHSPAVFHDFEARRLCVVPVRLQLHSFVDDFDVAVHVRALEVVESTRFATTASLFYEYPSKEFRWLGTGDLVEVLGPCESKSVELAVAVMAAGSYDLGERIEVSVYEVGRPSEAVIQRCRIESALIVINEHS